MLRAKQNRINFRCSSSNCYVQFANPSHAASRAQTALSEQRNHSSCRRLWPRLALELCFAAMRQIITSLTSLLDSSDRVSPSGLSRCSRFDDASCRLMKDGCVSFAFELVQSKLVALPIRTSSGKEHQSLLSRSRDRPETPEFAQSKAKINLEEQ